MPLIENRRNAWLLLIVFMIMALAPVASAQQSKLGKVDFPTSGSRKAQAHFLRGLAALHSFWYEEALEEFRESTKDRTGIHDGLLGRGDGPQPSALGRAGHRGRAKVIAKIKDTSKLTQRERHTLKR